MAVESEDEVLEVIPGLLLVLMKRTTHMKSALLPIFAVKVATLCHSLLRHTSRRAFHFVYRRNMGMSRELVVQLVARRTALNAEKFEIDEALSKLPPEHLWVVDKEPTEYPLELTPEEVEVKDAHLALNGGKLRVQAQLDRAYLIAPRDTDGPVPAFCIDCFIDHEKTQVMVEVESAWGGGVRQFECPACNHVLRVSPI